MRSHVLGLAAFGMSTVLWVGCSPPPAPAPEPSPQAAVPADATPPVRPGVSINAVMVALVDHAGHNLWNVELPGRAPKTDADWDVVEEHAVQLVASGPAITMGGTGPTDAIWVKNPAWQSHAQKLSDAGLAALRAAQSKNLEALVAANGQLVESCVGCHKEFKPDLPSEGILHKHVD